MVMTGYEQAYRDLRAGVEALAEEAEKVGHRGTCPIQPCDCWWSHGLYDAVNVVTALLASSATTEVEEPGQDNDKDPSKVGVREVGCVALGVASRDLDGEPVGGHVDEGVGLIHALQVCGSPSSAPQPSSAPATASEGARGLGVSVAASELRRLNRIGETRRDLISDEDWMWFCNHPLRLAHEHPIGWSAALGPVADWLDGITGVTSSDGDRGLSDEELDALLHWLHGGAAGGIQSLWAMVERILAARTAQPEGVDRIEWGVRYSGTDDVDRWCCESCATLAAGDVDDVMVRRTVTSWTDVTGPWEVVGDE